MTIIDKEKLKSFLSGMDWFEELHEHNEYVFDENGIRVSNPIDADKAKSAFLTGTELAQIEQHEKAMRLDLPSTPKAVLDWAQRNGFADALPDDFLESVQENAVTELQPSSKQFENECDGDLQKPSGIEDFQSESKKNKPKGKIEHPKTAEWKAKAWEIGRAWLIEQREDGKDPGVESVAKHVDAELSRLKITGARGYFLDWQTIKKEALKGITGKTANGRAKKHIK